MGEFGPQPRRGPQTSEEERKIIASGIFEDTGPVGMILAKFFGRSGHGYFKHFLGDNWGMILGIATALMVWFYMFVVYLGWAGK